MVDAGGAAARRADEGGAAAKASSPAASLDDWRLRRVGETLDDDPLLQALETLTRLCGRPTSKQALSATLPLPEGRMTPELALRSLTRAGFGAKLVKAGLDRIDPLALPCVLLLQDKGACVLVRRTARSVTILLPETGEGQTEVGLDRFSARYGGFAIFARAKVGGEPVERERHAERQGHWFWSTLFAQWPVYAEVVLAALLINCFALASPLFVMNVYDRVVPNNATDTLWVLAIGVATVFAFDFVLKLLRGYFIDAAGRVADIKLASRIFEQVMTLKMAVRPPSAGAFANQLREFETLRDFFTSATIVTLIDLPFVVLFIAIIALIGGPVALVPAVAVPAVIAVGLLLQIPLNKVVRRTYREAAQKHGVLVESLNGLETIKSIGAEGRLQRKWEGYVGATAESANRSRLLSAVTVNLAALATNLVTVGVIIVGVYQIGAGAMTVGALIASTILAGRAMAPLGQVAGILTRFHQSRTALDTLNRLMRLDTERPTTKNFVHRPRLKGAIEFKNVTFTYPDQKLAALSDVSFRVGPGERVGLVGRIGSGKTTIEKLVLNLFEPEGGAVLLDGTDARQIDPADLRRNIGCVPQDIFLFNGTVRENIALGSPQADDAAILRAAELAGVEDFVARHPLGYDLNVGERGEFLSGGQRQAVAVARALLRDPPVLILDEPTSAMDNGAENRLKTRLSESLDGQTLLLVTHRASLLALVDRLIVMDGGRVMADGPRDQILKALASGQIKGAA